MKTLFATLLILFASSALAALTPEQQQAKKRGLMLFYQYKIAEPELRIAAEAGDAEAQYYLAEELRQMNRYITPEAHKWYEAAASQGDFYAMIRLGRSGKDLCAVMGNCTAGQKTPVEWLRQALSQAKPKAEQGDAEAMYVMYHITGNRDWLEKSANAGHAIAQYWMAVGDSQGEGFFFLPGKRQESVERRFKASAEGGYPKAMMHYVGILHDKGDMKAARYWVVKAAETGFESGVTSLGAYSGHAPAKLGFPLDVVKGYGLISLLRELDGGGNVQVYVDDTLPKIAAKMTLEQIEQAKAFAKEWKATHPPLSFFPDKLGY
ncbi:tetratricopeptide repeat protein [Pseudomonas sp. NCHU5208]|uniref:tetratricopeptide repeat protein n=1 Tax=unclassified Pseudomonas TaxID=196821 RepID=UPI003F95C26C